MRMRIFVLIAFALIPSYAHALSCMKPVMTTEIVNKSKAIFEGTVIEMKSDGLLDKAKPAASKYSMYRPYIFIFHVNKAWKGVKVDELIEIRKNTCWGSPFSAGEDYFVVSETIKDGVHNLGNCGFSSTLAYAEEWLLFLKNHYAH